MFANAFFFLLLPERHSSRGYRWTLKRKIHFPAVCQQPRTKKLPGGQVWALHWMQMEGHKSGFSLPNSIVSRKWGALLLHLSLTILEQCRSLWGLYCEMTREHIKEAYVSFPETRDFLPRKANDTLCFLLWKTRNFDSLQIQMDDFIF